MAAKIPVVLDSATPELEELQAGDTIAISLFLNDSGYTTATGDALVANPLSQFASTTLVQLNGVLSDATLIDTADSRLSDARTPTAHNQAWSTITTTPTTMAGYGISDTKANFNTACSDGSFIFDGGALGTPTSGTLTNCTGYPTTGLGLTASPLSQFAATTSAQLAGVLSDETGSGAAVFATSPTLVTPALGTPASGTLTNCTGYPEPTQILAIACGDETTAITTGTGKAEFQIVDGAFTLTGIYATLTTAGTGSVITIDVNLNGTSIMTTNKITIDATEKTSDTAATAPALTTTALTENGVITVDFDAVDSGGVGAGPKVYLVGYWT